jgi:hypothetical protein
MELRELTGQEISRLADRKGAKKVAVENFLMSMGKDPIVARLNAHWDKKLYNWDKATFKAILDGMELAEN